MGIKTSLEAEVLTLEKGLQFCISSNLLPVILDTDSLIVDKVLSGVWEIPWSISLRIKRIKRMMRNGQMEVQHVLREGNRVS